MKEQDFIYKPDNIKNDISNKDAFFCLLQDKDFADENNNPRSNIEDSHKVLAKIKYKANGLPKYLIRIDATKKLLNPMLDMPEIRNIKLLHSISGQSLQFKEVNKKTFDFYLLFLKTNNPSWIFNAEREDI